MIVAFLLSIALVALTILIHYEALRLTAQSFMHIDIPVRARIIVVLAMGLLSHAVQVLLYALVYFWLHRTPGNEFVMVVRDEVFDLANAFYFSISSYTTLGIGDLVPQGQLRIISGVEALNGLVMVSWTASFTYLTMEKFWHLHQRDPKRGERRNKKP